jgi:hypothetical protein
VRPQELPPRLWRRRYLRILASRQRKREAVELRAIRATPVHPAHERWLRHRAFGGDRCRPYVVLADGQPFLAMQSYAVGPTGELCLRCGCLPGRRDHDCPDPCPCHESGNGVS